MLNVTKEYLLLFNAITDAEETLQQLRSNLIAVQQKAEELYVTADEPSGKNTEDQGVHS
ncbi:hypothetical protein SAMN05216343_11742 [Oscillibacter sp. PC13]|jgi:hypothetical protein|uniref:hypothetical protein n=1 Tax=Oscillibacter sp. PC13 TaxID=1855299 RepID=UPI0008F208B2|nr:hypothetical protein [Oscillibacter sp. PC13]SFP88754.1 hypothetical protein SAMN05216343_11742 [Oscillibacter sp. PC13]